MNRQKAILATLTILLYACLAGCSRSPVDVEQAVPEEMAFASETLDIRNCDSNDDMRTTLADQAPVKQEISIAEQATVVETGSAIDIPAESPLRLDRGEVSNSTASPTPTTLNPQPSP